MIPSKYIFALYKYNIENLEFERGYKINDNGYLSKSEDAKFCTVYWREVGNNLGQVLVTLPQVLRVESARLVECKITKVNGLNKLELIKSTPLVADFKPLVPFVNLQRETTVYHIEYYSVNNRSSQEVNPVKETLFYEGSAVVPHYKSLSKKYSKESGQQFFRKAFEGNISLFNFDYGIINEESVTTKFGFYAYKNGKLYLSSTFTKIDCKLDSSKKSAELKLIPEDEYTLLLSKYESTYDLIKLAPAITRVDYKKRPALQVYVQGGNTVSTYFNGLYEEQEASDVIDDSLVLQDTYHFGKVKTFQELNFINWPQMQLRGIYISDDKGTWASIDGVHKFTLRLAYSAGQLMSNTSALQAYHLSSDSKDSAGVNVEIDNNGDISSYAATNLYRIVSEGFSSYEYVSERLYTVTKGYALKAGETGYKLIEQGGLPSIELASFVTSYNVWARLIGDSDDLPYDLSSDDFAMPRANYKKCVGLSGDGIEDFIYQNPYTSAEPTKYGITDYGTYFTNTFFKPHSDYPYSTALPLARSSWVNSSLWVSSNLLDTFKDSETGELYIDKYTTKVVLRDGYKLSDVIKAMLKEIDPALTHEATEEYSSFLYASGNNLVTGFTNYDYIIAPKSNMLKGNYDQAAQKAELSFKELMDMLRDCFRCYWFIDSQKRFRIEHISYFMLNGVYSLESVPLFDLVAHHNPFNKKSYGFFQTEVAFDKTDLVSRYEFGWADDSSDAMGNIAVDINAPYVQSEKTESITPAKFSTDIDLMQLFPSNFGSDGFALLAVDRETRTIPLQTTYLWDETRKAAYSVRPQNFPVSWHRLINNYLYDMPGYNISYNTIPPVGFIVPVTIIEEVKALKKCMTSEVRFPVEDDPEEYSLVKTGVGVGVINSMLVSFETRALSATLLFYPA